MTKLRIRTLQKAEQRTGGPQQHERDRAGYKPVASRFNPHYDRWPSLPSTLPRTSH